MVDHKPGTLFITQTAMENHPGTRRRRNSARIFQDAPGIVLSDIDPSYLNALLPKPFVAAPIDDTITTLTAGSGIMGKPRRFD